MLSGRNICASHTFQGVRFTSRCTNVKECGGYHENLIDVFHILGQGSQFPIYVHIIQGNLNINKCSYKNHWIYCVQ